MMTEMMTEAKDLLWIIFKALAIILPLLLMVAYLTYAERRIIGFIQDRIGPNRVGPYGLFQPIADGLKVLFKEIIIPNQANAYLYIIAPALAMASALAAWAVIPFDLGLVLANINVGLLYLFAMTSLGVYGMIIAGWSSNSRYALLGAMRSAAQIVSYEIPMGFALVGVLIAAGSMNLSKIVLAQNGGIWQWYWLPLLPLFLVYWISAIAETNRAPFDVAEGESEIVAGFHVEYAGITFALFFLAEYMNMILVSSLTTIMFFGGWLSPFQGIEVLESYFTFVPGFVWFFAKLCFFLFLFLWVRATFPRYRYDQIMRLGWKVFIPITLIWIVVIAGMRYYHVAPWFKGQGLG